MVGKIFRGLLLCSIAVLAGCGSSSAPISVTISPASLSLDQAQTATFSATVANDSSGVTWSVSGGGTLSGMTSTGVTYNAPATVSAPTTATLTATSVKSTTESVSVSITVNPPPTITSPAALPNATAGVAYTATLTTSGGTGPFTWIVSTGSTLPAGLTLSSGGVLSGTVTAIGSSTFTVQVTDSGSPGVSVTEQLTFVVVPAPLVLTPPSSPLASTIAGTAYTSAAFTATGGTAPINWSATGLPAGLHLSATTGSSTTITGTPTAAGVSSIVVTAKDSGTPQQTQSTSALSLTVLSHLTTSSPTSFPSGIANQAYGQGTTNVDAGGGTPPYTWTLTGLPAGITCSNCASTIAGVSVQVSGTPTTAGTSTVTFSVKDSGAGALQQTAGGSFTFTIIPQLLVSTTTLPGGITGTAYPSTTLATTGGTGAVTWSATGLPLGLSINAATGVISGTVPNTTTGSPFSVVVTATDSGGLGTTRQIATKTLSLTLAQKLAITTASLPAGAQGSIYNTATLAASGGTGAITWTVSSVSQPPAGLVLSPSGVLSGTPTAVGTSTFTVTATDSGVGTLLQTASQQYTVTISAPGLVIATTSLPNGTAEVAYNATLQSSGGTPPIAWSVVGSVHLPTGLSLSAAGVISGTPGATTAGTYGVTFQATDSGVGSQQQTKTKLINLIIQPPPTLAITTTTLPNGNVGAAYSQTLQSSGGTGAVTWSISSGLLPTGLNLSAVGVITGTPTAQGTANFFVKAADSGNPQQSVTKSLSITISPSSPLTILTTSLPSGTSGNAYSAPIGVSGGVTPYSGSIISGALPAGLTLNQCFSNCGGAFQITGTPTANGTFNFTLQVTDSESPAVSKTQAYSLVIAPPSALAITNTTLNPSAGTQNNSYAASIYVTGGITPYTSSISSGSLPPGLSLLSCSGGGAFFCINGTPTTAGTYTFTLTVTDSESPAVSKSQQYTLVINPASPLTIQTTSLASDSGTATDNYGAFISVTGGTTPYSGSISSGSLPAGLQVIACNGNAGFCINGTPTTAGSSTFTLSVTDSESPAVTKTQQYTLVINPAFALTIQSQSLPNGTINTNYSSAIAVGGGATPYTEQVISGSLPPGITINGPCQNCNGYFSVSGLPTVNGTYTFTVKVTDSTSGTPQTATQSYTIIISNAPPLSIQTTTLGGGTVGFPYNNTLQANGGNQPYTWSATSGLPSWATLNASTGAISGTPPTGSAATSSVVVKVTDSSGTPQTATATLPLAVVAAGVNNSELNGTYVFRYGGFANGNATGAVYGVDFVGSFAADGNGNITSGTLNINMSEGPGGHTRAGISAFTGVYTIGADNRGTVVFTSANITFAVAVGNLSGGVAHTMRLIEFDDTNPSSADGIVGSGEAKLRVPGSSGPPSGNFVFGFQGESPCNSCGSGGATISPFGPVSAAGVFSADGAGNITSGEEVAAAENNTYSSITLSGTASQPNVADGAGTITLTPTGTIYPAAPTHFVYYQVSASEMYMMSTDSPATSTVLAGDVLLQQQTSFSNASLNGKSVAYEVEGNNGDGSSFYPSQSKASILLLTANGSGQLSAYQDSNNGNGNVKSGAQGPFPYSVAANGRVTLTGTGGGAPVFYLVNNNQGFFTETPSSGNGQPGLGVLEPQSAGPFTTTTLSGSYFLADVLPVVSSSTSSGVATVTNGSISVTIDNSDPSGALSTGQQQTFGLTADTTVSGRFTLPGGSNGGGGGVLYIISPTKAVQMDLSTGDTTPTVTVIEK